MRGRTVRTGGDTGVLTGQRLVRTSDNSVRVSRTRIKGRPEVPFRKWTFLLGLSVTMVLLVFVGRVQEKIPGFSSVPLGNVFVLLSVVGLAQVGYLKDMHRIIATKQGKLAAWFVAFAVLSVPFALWSGGALTALLAFLTTGTLFVLLVLAVRRPSQLLYVTSVFAIGAAILVSAYVVDWLFGSGALTKQEFVAFDRNDVALLSVMGIPFALAITVRKGRWSWLGSALAAFLALGVIATNSRGGFLALAATALFILLHSRFLSSGRKIALVVAGAAVLMVGGSSEYWERIEAIFVAPSADYNVTSPDGRIEVWKRGVGYFVSNPLTGVGIGNFPIAEGQTFRNAEKGFKHWSAAHNSYILVAAELGIGGLLVFLALLWSVARQARETVRLTRRRHRSSHSELSAVAEATQYSLVGYAVGGAFLSHTFAVSFVFLVAVGACLGLLTRAEVLTQRRLQPSGVDGATRYVEQR